MTSVFNTIIGILYKHFYQPQKYTNIVPNIRKYSILFYHPPRCVRCNLIILYCSHNHKRVLWATPRGITKIKN